MTKTVSGHHTLVVSSCFSSTITLVTISLKEDDLIETSFITPFGAYCYTTMSFGLKNIGATYQWVIQCCLAKKIGHNIEAYVNDVVVKSKTTDNLITDLDETFKNIREYRWKLNHTKCIFGVLFGILLRYIVSCCGIKAKPEKVSTVTNMK